MGADKLVPAVTAWSKDDPRVEQVARRRAEILKERHLPQVGAFPGARELVSTLKQSGLELAVAPSAPAAGTTRR